MNSIEDILTLHGPSKAFSSKPAASMESAPPAAAYLNGDLPKLAAELAAGLQPIPDILLRHNLTLTQLKGILRVPQFRDMVHQYKAEWASAGNTKERIRVKALIAVEESLEQLFAMFHDKETAPSNRLDAHKQLVQLADAAPRKDAPADGGPRFAVTINLPGEKQMEIVTQVEQTQNGQEVDSE